MSDPAEHYLQIYEALDTVVEDLAQLEITKKELLGMCKVGGDIVTVYQEVETDKALIDQRRDHVLLSVLSNTAITHSDIQIAGHEYLNKFDDPQEQLAASRRVRVYTAILDVVKNSGSVPRLVQEVSLDASTYATTAPPSVSRNFRLHGRRDEDDRGTWYETGNPRTVELLSNPNDYGVEGQVLGIHKIVEQNIDDNGVITVLTDGNKTIKVGLVEHAFESEEYMIVGGSLVLVKPNKRISLFEAGLRVIEPTLQSRDEATQVAVQAAGANIPNIINSFEHPDHANPVALSVAKTN